MSPEREREHTRRRPAAEPPPSRREFHRRALAGIGALALPGAVGGIGVDAIAAPASASAIRTPPLGKASRCIMLWLGGGAAQIDTFDPKRRGDPRATPKVPGSDYDAIPTAVPGVRLSEHMPGLADRLDRCAVIRTVHHNVIDEHSAATNLMHTGRPTSETIAYPSIGSIVAHELGPGGDDAPPYVVVAYPSISRGPGFLGSKWNYLYVTDPEVGPPGLAPPPDLSASRRARREALIERARERTAARAPDDPVVRDFLDAGRQAARLAGPDFQRLFQLDDEPASVREAYGPGFGQRCLLARRLVRAGTRFVEVSHNLNFVNGTGWDTHNSGQLNQHLLIRELDRALSALIDDLERLGELDDTLIAVSTEFGRPAEFDAGGGRGHQSTAFSCLLAGGGLRAGKAIGTTDELAKRIVDRPVSVPDFHATIHAALGINPRKELKAGDRPVPITDRGEPIAELFS